MSNARLVPLGAVVNDAATWNPQSSGSKESFPYIDIASIDCETKQIRPPAMILPSEAPSRARLLVRSDDVLVSTVRPNLNGVALVPVELDGATASTGFSVLRAIPSQVEPRYLYQWVRSQQFVRTMTARATGASYPAVTDRVVRESIIPLPPIGEQRRIVTVLDMADAIRRRRRESLELLNELERCAFLESFGDPVRNERDWETEFGDKLFAGLDYGTSVRCVRTPGPGALAVLRIPNVVRDEIQWDDLKYAELDEAEVRKLSLTPGDLLFVRTNGNPEYIGRCAVFDGSRVAAFASYLIRARVSADARCRPEFLKHVASFPTFRARFTSETRTTAGNYNISAAGLRRLEFIRPPLDLQDKFLRIAGTIKNHRAALAGSLVASQQLFESLSQRAFSGQLA